MRINTIRLRKILGFLGLLLPWIVTVLNGSIPSSISATYYNDACITPFMIILGASSVLLMCYKGYDVQDDIVLTLSGLFGLGICLFPTYTSTKALVGTFQIPALTCYKIHNTCAIAFFILLAYNSIFLFTKGDKNPTKNKKIRNIIYIVCGLGMLASFSIFLLPRFEIRIWLAEAIALTFFGISFLTKANTYKWLFCDKDE